MVLWANCWTCSGNRVAWTPPTTTPAPCSIACLAMTSPRSTSVVMAVMPTRSPSLSVSMGMSLRSSSQISTGISSGTSDASRINVYGEPGALPKIRPSLLGLIITTRRIVPPLPYRVGSSHTEIRAYRRTLLRGKRRTNRSVSSHKIDSVLVQTA